MRYQSSSLGVLEVSPVLLVIHLEGHMVLLENRVSQILMVNHRLPHEMAIFGTPVYPIVTDPCLNHDQMHIPCDKTKTAQKHTHFHQMRAPFRKPLSESLRESGARLSPRFFPIPKWQC